MAEFEGLSDTIQPCGGTTLTFNLDLLLITQSPWTISRRDQTKRQSAVATEKPHAFLVANLKQKTTLVLLVRAAYFSVLV